MIATSADVARHAGVSRATVSQVLNGYAHRFAPETAEKVRAAARELDYQPSAAGRTLRNGASDFVIALVPNTTFGGNLQDLFESATETLAERGLTLVLRLSTRSSTSLDRLVAGMKPRAVLSLQPLTDVEKRVLDDREVPWFDPSPARDFDFRIGQLQADHLIDRGYKRLAFAHLQDARQDPFGLERERGVAEACGRHGLPEPTSIGLGLDPDQAKAALDAIGVGYGVACYNDDVAITLLMAANAADWDVPGDIGLVGMDNTPLARVTNPRLVTVGYDMDVVARNTVAAALRAMGEGEGELYGDINLRLIPGGSA